jgi:hypothetical protein
VLDWRDRTIGIVLGVVIGVAVVVAFVFFLSEQTVDAPSLSTDQTTVAGNARDHDRQAASHDRGGRTSPAPPAVATVRVAGGAPPRGGPPELHYTEGDRIRLVVVSDSSVDLELTGYGLTRTVPAGEPTQIEFDASRAGTFALIVAESNIAVARITVGAPSS